LKAYGFSGPDIDAEMSLLTAGLWEKVREDISSAGSNSWEALRPDAFIEEKLRFEYLQANHDLAGL